MKTKSQQKIIGRTELVDLPEWSFNDLEAKIDTGAYTSSLHCHDIQYFKKNEENWIKFYLLDPEHEAYNEQEICMPVHAQKDVKSSNGETELRYFIKTKIDLFDEIFDIEFSLTDRSAMKYPLLLGRKFLQKTMFLVDVTKSNLNKTNS